MFLQAEPSVSSAAASRGVAGLFTGVAGVPVCLPFAISPQLHTAVILLSHRLFFFNNR